MTLSKMPNHKPENINLRKKHAIFNALSISFLLLCVLIPIAFFDAIPHIMPTIPFKFLTHHQKSIFFIYLFLNIFSFLFGIIGLTHKFSKFFPNLYSKKYPQYYLLIVIIFLIFIHYIAFPFVDVIIDKIFR